MTEPLNFYDPPSDKERIEAEMARKGVKRQFGKPERPADFGLFDNGARKQEELF